MNTRTEHKPQQDISQTDFDKLSMEVMQTVLFKHGYRLIRHEPRETLLAVVIKELERGEIKLDELGLADKT